MGRKTRAQREGESPQKEADQNTSRDSSEESESTLSELKDLMIQMQENQKKMQESINDTGRLSKTEDIVDKMGTRLDSITESLEIITPKLGELDERLTSIEQKLDQISEKEGRPEVLEDVERALPRIGDMEDRIREIEKKIGEYDTLTERVKDLEANSIWEEYERKKDNLVAYGVQGSEKPANSPNVAREFMVKSLKLDKEYVDKIQIKSAARLQGNGKGPPPLRITFLKADERDTCLRQGPKLKGTKESLRTDLPKSVRIKRAKLAATGHTLKANGTVVHTRLREKAINVWLEVKKTEESDWKTWK